MQTGIANSKDRKVQIQSTLSAFANPHPDGEINSLSYFPLKHKILDDLEELEDIKLYDEAKKGKKEFIDVEQAFNEIEEARKNESI